MQAMVHAELSDVLDKRREVALTDPDDSRRIEIGYEPVDKEIG